MRTVKYWLFSYYDANGELVTRLIHSEKEANKINENWARLNAWYSLLCIDIEVPR